ncbi:citrate/2-methylcitrate synthase [Xanthomonas bromi]|uniref:citrate/2-methylcitrate synthase n=1 Tax=Xanthomonas bromi TaxID=56449 RepID=UPI001ADECAA7|nr:citrate/2-methylcitrate synthase [Xanthomonas bromi]
MRAVVASVLGIDASHAHAGLEYQSIQQWDSLRHAALMLALEKAFDVEISDNRMVELSSVQSIIDFIEHHAGGQASVAVPNDGKESSVAGEEPVHRGLSGIYFDRSRISRIDGEAGHLEYRGYSLHDLVGAASFEDVCHLLVEGELPTVQQHDELGRLLADARMATPPEAIALARSMASVHPMEALRTGVSFLGSMQDRLADDDTRGMRDAGLRLLAQVPVLVAAHHCARRGMELRIPGVGTPFTAALLHMLSGRMPDDLSVAMMDRDLIVHAEHSSNASAFTARVVIGCRAGVHAAITAAIAAFSGNLHGGAAEEVMKLVDEVGRPERAAAYVEACFASGKPVMGFGHRVYRTEDPRVRHLRDAAWRVSRESGDTSAFETIQAVVDAMRPYARHGVEANVDLYSGLLYRKLGLPDDLAVPLFVVSRMAGWLAQVMEQMENNVLIRPLLKYTGERGRRLEIGVRG